jgi:hypothetical protein
MAKKFCWLLKIDNNGNVLWDKTIGGPEGEFPERGNFLFNYKTEFKSAKRRKHDIINVLAH